MVMFSSIKLNAIGNNHPNLTFSLILAYKDYKTISDFKVFINFFSIT